MDGPVDSRNEHREKKLTQEMDLCNDKKGGQKGESSPALFLIQFSVTSLWLCENLFCPALRCVNRREGGGRKVGWKVCKLDLKQKGQGGRKPINVSSVAQRYVFEKPKLEILLSGPPDLAS
ncbi:hypothetical protein SLA2020_333310 [Shorea laevis]